MNSTFARLPNLEKWFVEIKPSSACDRTIHYSQVPYYLHDPEFRNPRLRSGSLQFKFSNKSACIHQNPISNPINVLRALHDLLVHQESGPVSESNDRKKLIVSTSQYQRLQSSSVTFSSIPIRSAINTGRFMTRRRFSTIITQRRQWHRQRLARAILHPKCHEGAAESVATTNDASALAKSLNWAAIGAENKGDPM